MATLGEMLRSEREVRGVTLHEIARATRINEKYLRAIEEDDYNSFQAPVFIMGFLRAYAGHLGLDSDEIITQFESLKIKRKKEYPPTQPIDLGDNNAATIAVVIFAILAIGGYAAWSSWQSMAPVALLSVPDFSVSMRTSKVSPIDSPVQKEAAGKTPLKKVHETGESPEGVSIDKSSARMKPSPSTAPSTDLSGEPPIESEKRAGTDKTVALSTPVSPVGQGKKISEKKAEAVQLKSKKDAVIKEETAKATPQKTPATAKATTGANVDAKLRTRYKYNLAVSAGQKDAWIFVVIDGKVVKDMFVRAGRTITLWGNESFIFSTGNAEHVSLSLNGRGIPVEVPPGNVILRWRLPIPEDG